MVFVNCPFHDPSSASCCPAGGPSYSHHHQHGALVPEHSHSQGPEQRGGESSGSIVGGTTSCHDCENQPKKDCLHRSTWVPAARRRERHMAVVVTGEGAAAAGGVKIDDMDTFCLQVIFSILGYDKI
ncbi:hypothetical protein AMTRI_Chr13g89260 [Amborella trichopoda]